MHPNGAANTQDSNFVIITYHIYELSNSGSVLYTLYKSYMNDTIQPSGTGEIVFKYTTAMQAFKVGIFGAFMGCVILLSYFKSNGRPYPSFPPWVSLLLLIIGVCVLGAGLIAIFTTRWITVTINNSQSRILVAKRGVISTHQTFSVTDVASVALHRIWRIYGGLYVSFAEVHDQQLCIVLKNGVRIPLKNEVNERPDTVETDVSLGTRTAQLINVPFERTGPS